MIGHFCTCDECGQKFQTAGDEGVLWDWWENLEWLETWLGESEWTEEDGKWYCDECSIKRMGDDEPEVEG